MNRLLLLMGCIICFANCNNNKVPSGVLSKEKMQEVMWDILRVESYTENLLKTDSLKNLQDENLKLQQKVFAIHRITKEDFYKSYDYYKQRPELFSEMLDSMTVQKSRERTLQLNKKTEVKKPALSKPK